MKREPKSDPALLLAPLFSRSLTLVPRSFLLNRTETLATQASGYVEKKTPGVSRNKDASGRSLKFVYTILFVVFVRNKCRNAQGIFFLS